MSNEKCICVGERGFRDKPAQGLLKPLFWLDATGKYKKITADEFPNNGLIFVTRGYETVTDSPSGTFFEVTSNEAPNWEPAHDASSKFSTYQREMKKVSVRDIALCAVVDGTYPDFSDSTYNVITVDFEPTSSFFLRCKNPESLDVLIGPLDAYVTKLPSEPGSSQSDFKLTYQAPDRPFKHPWGALTDSAHCVYQIEIDTLPDGWSQIAENSIEYVETDLLVNGNKTLLDLSNNAQILRWFQHISRRSPSAGHEAVTSKLKEIADHFSTADLNFKVPDEIFQQRRERLNNLPVEVSGSDEFGDLMRIFLETDAGNKRVSAIVEGNLDKYLKLAKNDAIESLNVDNELRKYNFDVEFAREKKEKEDELDFLTRQVRERRDDVQRDTIAELEVKIEALRAEQGMLEDVHQLGDRKNYLERNIEELTKTIVVKEETLREIKNKTSKSVESHRRDLIGLKLDLDILDGRGQDDGHQNKKVSYPKPASYKSISAVDDDDKREEILQIIHRRMENQGFEFDRSVITKMVISLSQNLVITLAGHPGSGKTTAASALAKGLGLVDAKKYVHIQVQRGWTSDKDLLGFNNRLTQLYEKDRYGFHDLLTKLQGAENEDSMALVTLDEANLSPLEYYFSTFMGSFDDRSKFFTNGDMLDLPAGLRFIATVNNDRTTEVLSDRFLDRSPVIVMKSSSSDSFDTRFDRHKNDKYEEFSFDEVSRLFISKSKDPLNQAEKRVLTSLRDEHHVLPIEKRKYNAIAQFTDIGRGLMSQAVGEDESWRMRALDEAVLTFLLPKISGQGHDYREELNRLSGFLEKNDLVESSAAINRIIRKSQYETYSFFS